MSRPLRLCVPLALGAICLLPSAAQALTPDADCQAHLNLTRSYTIGQLEHGLATMPADESEYTDCPDVLQHALDVAVAAKRAGGSGRSGGGGGSSLSTVLIVVLIVVILGGAGATVAARRRGQPDAHRGQPDAHRGESDAHRGEEP
jgi:hypothetical protein